MIWKIILKKSARKQRFCGINSATKLLSTLPSVIHPYRNCINSDSNWESESIVALEYRLKNKRLQAVFCQFTDAAQELELCQEKEVTAHQALLTS